MQLPQPNGGPPREGRRIGILFALPTLLVLGATVVYPILTIIFYSFHKVGLAAKADAPWVGLQNYADALEGGFLGSVTTSLVVTTASVVITLVVGMALAVLLDGNFPGRGIARSLIVLPWAMPTFAAAFAWRWMLDYNYGSVNHLLMDAGAAPVAFLSENATAVATGILVYVWKGLPWAVIVFLAALQAVPHELREAARVDGASPRWEFRHVALPGVRFGVQIVGILLFVWNFNWFDMMWLLTRGGPGTATRVLPIEIYRQAFSSFNLGEASAIAVLVLLLLAVFAAVVFKLTADEDAL